MIIGSGAFLAVASNIRFRYFDEVIMMLSIYTFMAYTPWVEDPPTKFFVGYISISLIVLHVVNSLGQIAA